MKSPVPDMELRPGQQVDINALLSLLEDIIRVQDWAATDFYTDEIKKDHSKILSLHSVNLQGSHNDVLDIPLSGFFRSSQQFLCDWLIILTTFDNLGVRYTVCFKK